MENGCPQSDGNLLGRSAAQLQTNKLNKGGSLWNRMEKKK